MLHRLAARVIAYAIALTSIASFAQTPVSQVVAGYQQEIQNCRNIVNGWERNADIEIGLTLAVIVFGAGITVLQGSTKGWCKATTVVLGAATTVFTAVNAKVFAADYRMLQQSAIDAQDYIDQLETLANSLSSTQSPAEQRAVEVQWIATITKFRGLEKQVVQGVRNTANASFFLMRPDLVLAASDGPAWARKPPAPDSYSLYFVGRGEDASIGKAREQALDNGIENAVKQLAAKPGSSPEVVRKLVDSLKNVDSTSFDYDKNSNVYHYYTLLRLSKEIENLDLSANANSVDTSKSGSKCVSMKVLDHEIVPVMVAGVNIYVYLVGQSQSIKVGRITPLTKARMVLLSLPITLGRTKVNGKTLQTLVAKSTSHSEIDEISNGETREATIEDHRYAVQVTTHYVRQFAEISVCPAI